MKTRRNDASCMSMTQNKIYYFDNSWNIEIDLILQKKYKKSDDALLLSFIFAKGFQNWVFVRGERIIRYSNIIRIVEAEY